MHLSLLGEINDVLDHPVVLRYDLHVVEAEELIDDAIRRIRQAARKYHLKPSVTQALIGGFLTGTSARG